MNIMEERVRELLTKPFFEPFRIRLVNSCFYDVFVQVQLQLFEEYVCFYGRTAEWAEFPYSSIANIESLVEYLDE